MTWTVNKEKSVDLEVPTVCRSLLRLQVDKLGKLFEEEFHFNTEYLEIPSHCWETALHCRVAEFCHNYNSPEDLAIVITVDTHTKVKRPKNLNLQRECTTIH
jgi:hypothetical protein